MVRPCRVRPSRPMDLVIPSSPDRILRSMVGILRATLHYRRGGKVAQTSSACKYRSSCLFIRTTTRSPHGESQSEFRYRYRLQ